MNRVPLLFLNVFIIATCGLVYELIAGTVASYLLGDSVTQFSFCIGIYLSALGVGAWLSKFIDKWPARYFIEVELGVALLGGVSAPLLFLSFSHLDFFKTVLYGIVFCIGVLVGLELPLLMHILKSQLEFKELVARVLTFDYIGALVASLLFPIFLVPELGLVRTSLVFGLLNCVVGLWGTWLLASILPKDIILLRVRAIVVMTILVIGIIKADHFTTMAEDRVFGNKAVYSSTSKYQRIVITRIGGGFNLFLNGNLQFSSIDEYRYHEALVHPAMHVVNDPKNILVLGGGDGLGTREVLKYPSVESITLVDLDPAMTDLSKNYPPLGELNNHALDDPRVTVVNQDAMIWLERNGGKDKFDAILIDFPDPNNFALGKLYTRRFYQLVREHLEPGGAVAIQSTSPMFARNSYWCIINTMRAAGLHVNPYQVAVPSFGIWGFALARHQPFESPRSVMPELKYLNDQTMQALFVLPNDLGPIETEINRLDNQALVRYYDNEWKHLQ
ncbi:MAG: spermidine synthase [Planctomycetaceae bacterium]|nr:spermidine synthase [Planctomycetaceae bacterium]